MSAQPTPPRPAPIEDPSSPALWRQFLPYVVASLLFAAYVVYLADPPAAFAALGVVAVLLDLALCWFLLQPDSGEWVRGAALADEVEHAG